MNLWKNHISAPRRSSGIAPCALSILLAAATGFADGEPQSYALDLSGGDQTVVVGAGSVHTITSISGNSSANLTVVGGGTLVLPSGNLSSSFAWTAASAGTTPSCRRCPNIRLAILIQII